MKLKMPDKGQWAFIIVVMALATWYAATVLVYFYNNYSIKYIFKRYDSGVLSKILLQGTWGTELHNTALLAILTGLAVSLVVPALVIYTLNQKKQSLFGDAKFASDRDIKKSEQVVLYHPKKDGGTGGKSPSLLDKIDVAKLLEKKEFDKKVAKRGVLIGKYKGKYLWYLADDFISLGAGTRAGKGAAIGIPNLLTWQDSIIILDPKQECMKITSKVREMLLGQKVYLLDPFNKKTDGFNPFYYIDLEDDSGSKDLLKLVEILFPSYGQEDAGSHFNNQAGLYFQGLTKLLYFFINYKPEWLKKYNIKPVFCIASVVDLYGAINTEEVLGVKENFLSTNMTDNMRYHLEDAFVKIKKYSEKDDKDKSNTDSSFTKKMSLFYLPSVRACTSFNSFDLRQLRREKISIYVGINADDLSLSYDFLNLFFNYVIEITLRENPDFDSTLTHTCLMLMDEFPAIGRMEAIKRGSGYIAGFNLRLLTIYQNISQLREIYGLEGAKTLMSGHPCRIIYAVSEQDDANEVSEKLGYITTKSKGESKSRSRTSTKSESENEAKRALVLPQELGTLQFREEFIILKGENPIKCEKALYFNDAFFMDKLLLVSPKLTQKVMAMNKKKTVDGVIGVDGLSYPSKVGMLSLGELESDRIIALNSSQHSPF
ncbi:conjugal transfer protein TraG [Escherichia coli]|jgi:type IV secretion system protein VirD4|nr:type IV secretory system conjugative DNA transfer family protein [Escherichia coli]EFU0718367.1 type IV secretory system conjugative DNA transfer family protein [Escherichia coli]RXJ65316.1 conjugal transfer protein TraG [Escherichia coli]HAH1938853.1 TraM recognition domain-containing protein [Escherichia coli]HAH1977938.1 TraM recognition domain-containing protein [Escherichia coli]